MTKPTIAGFAWDRGNLAKCQAHGLTIAEVEGVFTSPHRIYPDLGHSAAETRFFAIGNGSGTRPIFAAFTLRTRGGKRMIRPISARYMHRKESEAYDQAIAQPNR